MSNWLGPFKTADDAIDALRRSVAEIIGADPDTWPDHKNAPLAISAAVGLREGAIKQLRKERDALRAELDALKASFMCVHESHETLYQELRANPVPASVPTETITDYLVSISAHVANRDDAQAQKELGELLKMLAAAPEVE